MPRASALISPGLLIHVFPFLGFQLRAHTARFLPALRCTPILGIGMGRLVVVKSFAKYWACENQDIAIVVVSISFTFTYVSVSVTGRLCD